MRTSEYGIRKSSIGDLAKRSHSLFRFLSESKGNNLRVMIKLAELEGSNEESCRSASIRVVRRAKIPMKERDSSFEEQEKN